MLRVVDKRSCCGGGQPCAHVWQFEVDSYDFETRSIGWTKGGYQGARGNDRGAEWYVENVFEELVRIICFHVLVCKHWMDQMEHALYLG